MTGNEYTIEAMRTNDGGATMRLENAEGIFLSTGKDFGGILNGCLGLAGETGELLDMVKKSVFHEVVLDEEHAKKELGDVMWYVAMICRSFGWSLDEIMKMNIDKLKARYPEGFNIEKSAHRQSGDV